MFLRRLFLARGLKVVRALWFPRHVGFRQLSPRVGLSLSLGGISFHGLLMVLQKLKHHGQVCSRAMSRPESTPFYFSTTPIGKGV